jgi:four helix bundle protein
VATSDELKQRTKRFALDVLAFVRMLPSTDESRDIGRQLTRSATAVGANYRSACRARSHSEFLARAGIVLEEADESSFWFEILIEAGLVGANARGLLDEAKQLTAIFAQTCITGNMRRQKEEGRR